MGVVRRQLGSGVCAGLLLAWACASCWAQDSHDWQYGVSLSYLTGDYGEPGDTDLVYMPFVVKRYLAKGDVTLTVPYIDISSDGGATFVAGEVESVQGGSEGGSGLGDIILKGRYYAVAQEGNRPFVDLVAGIKLPTADDGKGLGTGEFDLSFLLELARRFENEWIGLFELGYTLIGEPPGTDLNSRLVYSVGTAFDVNPEVMLSGYLDGRTAITDGADDPLSILLIGEFKHSQDLRIDAMFEVGLNDGAPDYGITLGVRKRL